MIQERDSYKCKLHRLNHSMGALLKCNGHHVLDLDGILSENRFLRESLDQVREEKQLANDIGRKYKLALEQSTQRRRLGSNSCQDNNSSSPNKQNKYSNICDDIKELMSKTSFPCPKDLDVTKPDQLQELCMSLLETLKDRMLQFTQQKRANKQLMSRLEEVESQVQIGTNLEIGQLILHPSSFLMRDYSSANVDEDINSMSPANDAMAIMNNRLNDSCSIGSSVSVDDQFSSEVADLYTRFQKLARSHSKLDEDIDPNKSPNHSPEETDNCKADSPLAKNHPPPDLIAQDFGPRGVSYHKESLNISDIENDYSDQDDSSTTDNETEKHEIILPEHLQRLVDRAMVDIIRESED